MLVNPQYLNNVSQAINQTSAVEEQLTEELSTGSSIQQLSDNPVAVGQNVGLNAAIMQDDSYQQTASTSESMLQVTDSALGNVVTQVNKAISLSTEGNNGTLNSSQQKDVAQQLEGIRDEILSIANTSYLGQYLFSGSANTQPFTLDESTSPASVTYNGDSTVNSITTPEGQEVALNVPGNQIFTASGANLLGTLNALISDYNSGDITQAQSDSTNLSTALNAVDQQRITIDNSITRLTATSTYAQTQSTQLQAAQTNLMQADLAGISTQLKDAETQQAALSEVFSSLGSQSLFNYING